MHIMAPILLLALLGLVQPLKLSKHQGGQLDNQPPLPPPQPPQPAPQLQQQEQFEQQTLLYPNNNDYGTQQLEQQSYQQAGAYDTKGLAAKPEREIINRPTNQQGYLPNPHPQALAYVIVRPINYPQTVATGYSGQAYNEYGYNNNPYNNNPYNNNPYNNNPYNNNPYSNYNRPPYNPNQNRPPYNPYGGQQPLLGSNLRAEEQHLEGDYQYTKDSGVKQKSQQVEQQQPTPVDQQPPLDLYAEKKGKLQRLMDKIHSIIPFGSTYQLSDDVPPPNQPQPPAQQPQVQETFYRPAPIQQQAISQIREPIPEQQSLDQQQLHDDREVIREPEQLHQEPLKEEKGHSKPYRETSGELKREKEPTHSNNLPSNLPQDVDSGFASSKRASTN